MSTDGSVGGTVGIVSLESTTGISLGTISGDGVTGTSVAGSEIVGSSSTCFIGTGTESETISAEVLAPESLPSKPPKAQNNPKNVPTPTNTVSTTHIMAKLRT